ncbi:response regulator [Flavobacterium hydrophilum]|uniref:Response regulator n=1 Tax=Flavobacterium hydrophilum TaxID=2211445 RepID=A0A2V4C005_9FLAO|nr:response regulator [Flavobacterium hydrophilum]PXY43250.1 response regulator [Flavobacterium hydrophilum]
MEFKPLFLLIEDNLIDQIVTQQLLKKVFHVEEIIIANNGKEGIEWLEENKTNRPVIILLDIQMPIMNGFEFLEEYENLQEEIKLKSQIYVLSSTLDSDEIKKIKETHHVIDFLNKPLSVEYFRSKI